jgi:hypothetical protein
MTSLSGEPQTLAEQIRTEHSALRALLEAATQPSPPDDARAGLRAMDAFVVGVCEHLGAEAEVLHPVAHELLPDGASAVAEAAPCHTSLQRQMRMLEQQVWGDARSAPTEMAELRDEIESTFDEHVRHDEALAVRVDEALDPEQSRLKAEDLRRAAAHAPTRPHPHAPQTGPLARPLRWLAGRWDDVLDTVDVRSAAGERSARPRRPLGLWSGYLVGRAPTADPDPRKDPAT